MNKSIQLDSNGNNITCMKEFDVLHDEYDRKDCKERDSEKFIAFFMDEEDIENLCVDFKHGYYETLKAIENGEEEIYTTQLSLLHASLFRKGYKIYVREKDKDMFEIKLGENERTNRIIREGHNLEKMLIAGEFGNKIYKTLE